MTDNEQRILTALASRAAFLDGHERPGLMGENGFRQTYGGAMLSQLQDFERGGWCRSGFRVLFDSAPSTAEAQKHSRTLASLAEAGLIDRESANLARLTDAGRAAIADSKESAA